MKRILVTMLFAICVLAGTAAGSDVKAEEQASGTEGVICGDFEYEVSGYGIVEITGYHGIDTELVIPAELDGKEVNSIGSQVFLDSIVNSVIIPDSVTTIQNYAFMGCSSLRSVTLPDSITMIDNGVFWDCINLESITLPDGITCIMDYAFENCSSLSSVIIPDSVTEIGMSFQKCSSLKSIVLPDSITKIEGPAFRGCSALESITLPKSITNIHWYLFEDCSSLKSITIPDSVTSIEGEAFKNCSSLSSIIIPDGVTSIEKRAFENCSSLSSITIPDSVTNIKDFTFMGCSSLKSIHLPYGITGIGFAAFHSCSNLSSIVIPDSVTDIGRSAFAGCTSLSSIAIPDNVTSIGIYAFGDCPSLTSIKLPYGITDIKEGTFNVCRSLNSITIPNSVTNIEACTFLGCSSLHSITIPNSVTSIDNGVFDSNLKHIYYTGSRKQWLAIFASAPNNQAPDYIEYRIPVHCTDGDILPTNQVTPDVTPLTANNVKLSAAKVTYNGKAQTPAVFVTDNQGKTVADSGYTVQYTDHTNVGQASVTVTFQGSYSGTVTKTFDIVPKGTKISKVTAKKKGFLVKWKKQAVQTSGYEIQYSVNGKFKSAKTAGNVKAKKTSKTVSKLKAKKKYYVRIRTYKTVNGKNYYSDWSAKKSVKTKK